MQRGKDTTAELLGHAGWLEELAKRLVGDAAAEDAVQAVWLRATQRPPATLVSPKGWLRSTLRSVHLRGVERREAAAERDREAARGESLPSAEELAEKAEGQHLLVAAVLALGEPEREAVLLHFFEGLSAAEIARRSGVPSSTVRTRIGRGVDQLRGGLDRAHGGPAAWVPAVALLAPKSGASTFPGAVWASSLLTLGTAFMWKIGWTLAVSVAGIVLLAWGGGFLGGGGPEPVEVASGSTGVEVDDVVGDQGAAEVEPMGADEGRVELSVTDAAEVVAGNAATDPADGIAVRGRVVNPHGAIVAGAEVFNGTLSTVSLWQRFPEKKPKPPSVTTDKEGRFTLTLESNEAIVLCAHAEGLANSAELAVPNPGSDESQDLLLTLRLGATLTGTVYGKDQLPIEGRSVGVSSSELGEYRRVNTDELGRFKLEKLGPGPWRAATYPCNEELRARGIKVDTASAMAELKQAEFTLVDGETTDVPLGLVAEDAPRITGVLRHLGEPIGGLMQWYPAARPTEKMVSRAGKDGAFEVDLPGPGKWIVHVNAAKAKSRGQRYGYDFAAGERRSLEIDLRGGAVSGVVHGPDGELLRGVEVELRALVGAPHLPNPTLGGGRIRTDKEGAYTFELLRPGSYVVVAHGSGQRKLKTTRKPKPTYAATHTDPIDVAGEARVEASPIFLTEATTFTISVHDPNGRPVTGASLYFHDSDGYCLNPSSNTRSSSKEPVHSPGLPKGPVWVTAVHKTGTSEPKLVTVGTDQETTLVLGRAHWIELATAGEWLDEANSHVSITDSGGRQWARLYDIHRLFDARPRRDDPKGPMFGPLPGGSYRIRVDGPKGSTLSGFTALGDGAAPVTTVQLR